MKKSTALILSLICIAMFLVGCSRASKESTFQPADVENVSMSMTNISSTGATVTIEDTNEEPGIYGNWYVIEKEVDGKWYQIEPKLKNYGFTEEGYLVGEDDEVEFHIDWQWIYGELPSGRYRLLKSAKKQYISVMFDIVKE